MLRKSPFLLFVIALSIVSCGQKNNPQNLHQGSTLHSSSIPPDPIEIYTPQIHHSLYNQPREVHSDQENVVSLASSITLLKDLETHVPDNRVKVDFLVKCPFQGDFVEQEKSYELQQSYSIKNLLPQKILWQTQKEILPQCSLKTTIWNESTILKTFILDIYIDLQAKSEMTPDLLQSKFSFTDDEISHLPIVKNDFTFHSVRFMCRDFSTQLESAQASFTQLFSQSNLLPGKTHLKHFSKQLCFIYYLDSEGVILDLSPQIQISMTPPQLSVTGRVPHIPFYHTYFAPQKDLALFQVTLKNPHPFPLTLKIPSIISPELVSYTLMRSTIPFPRSHTIRAELKLIDGTPIPLHTTISPQQVLLLEYRTLLKTRCPGIQTKPHIISGQWIDNSSLFAIPMILTNPNHNQVNSWVQKLPNPPEATPIKNPSPVQSFESFGPFHQIKAQWHSKRHRC